MSDIEDTAHWFLLDRVGVIHDPLPLFDDFISTLMTLLVAGDMISYERHWGPKPSSLRKIDTKLGVVNCFNLNQPILYLSCPFIQYSYPTWQWVWVTTNWLMRSASRPGRASFDSIILRYNPVTCIFGLQAFSNLELETLKWRRKMSWTLILVRRCGY